MNGVVSKPPALEAQGLTVRFGGIAAVSDVALRVPAGAITGLVGPNGAGKTTTFAVLSGLLKASGGRVVLNGVDVTCESAQQRARRGLARTFQQTELFSGLTVREHLVLADRVVHSRGRLWKDVFTGGALRPPTADEDDRVHGILERLSLLAIAHQSVDALPLGTRRLVETARALACRPSVLLLDEPFSGLNHHEGEALAAVISKVVAAENVATLLVAHDVPLVLGLCAHIYVLDFGVLIAEGSPEEIRSSSVVRSAYLGNDVTPPLGDPTGVEAAGVVKS